MSKKLKYRSWYVCLANPLQKILTKTSKNALKMLFLEAFNDKIC